MRRTFAGTELLRLLEPEQQRLLEASTRVVAVKRGRRIYTAGEPSNDLFLVTSGVVKLTTRQPGGLELILEFLYPDEIFGEGLLFDDTARDHNAEAHADCVLSAMPRDVIVTLMQQSVELGLGITTLFGLRARRLRTRLRGLLCKSAVARLAQALVDLGDDRGVREFNGTLIPMRLTQREIGCLVGLSRETVNAILQTWRDDGFIDLSRHSIRLRQPEALRRLSSGAARSRGAAA